MKVIEDLKDACKGETILIVGNGSNLELTPPENLPYTSIGMNTIHKREGEWMPDYYVAVDHRVVREFGADIAEKYKQVIKVVPKRIEHWRRLGDENFIVFRQRPGVLWDNGKSWSLWQDDLSCPDVTYGNSMHLAMKLAYHLGAQTILIVGMEHDPRDGRPHFWGLDEGMPQHVPLTAWLEGYKILKEHLNYRGIQVLNLSINTHVSEEILPRDSYEKWRQNG